MKAMKKTYMIPEMNVININFKRSLLSGSPNGQNAVNPDAAPVNANTIEARGSWFDEGEE